MLVVMVMIVVVCQAGLRRNDFGLLYSMAFRHFTALADRIDRLNTAVGRVASWCALAIVLIGFAVVLMRYVLGLGSIWLQETVIYAHAALFLLAAAWTLREGGHVRVDVFYAGASPRAKAWVDLLGALLLLLPFAAAIMFFAYPYVMRSWMILERSRETSGLPLVFLLKTLIPLFALLLALQGMAQIVRAVGVLFPHPASRAEGSGRA
jgi:TRAP-type mannitol/chloroaromatic compound transport system permease small subunit